MHNSLKKLLLFTLIRWLIQAQIVSGQSTGIYLSAHAHSHNDYEQTIPFGQAYDQQFGSIEADIYARDGKLYVAHDSADITPIRTLEANFI